MGKGRNTSVVSVRLPDDVVNRLKKLAGKNKVNMNDLLKPVILDFSARGSIRGDSYYFINRQTKPEAAHIGSNIDGPSGVDRVTDYWQNPAKESEASPKPASRSKGKAKRKAKRKRRH